MQGGLEEPLVIHDAVALQVGLHAGDIYRQAVLSQLVQPLLLRQVLPAVPVLLIDGLGQLLDIVAVVALLGEGEVLLAHDELHVPGIDGHGKLVDLVAGVVDVELLPGVTAVPLEDVGQGITQHAAAGVAHVHGAGGVGRDKLHHDLLPVALGVGAVLSALPLYRGEDLAVPLGTQSKVQETGAGDLHLLEVAALQLQVIHDGLGDGTGGLVQGLGSRHGKGGGVVPVGGILGNLDGGLHLGSLREQSGLGGLLIGLLGQLCYLSPGRLDHI